MMFPLLVFRLSWLEVEALAVHAGRPRPSLNVTNRRGRPRQTEWGVNPIVCFLQLDLRADRDQAQR